MRVLFAAALLLLLPTPAGAFEPPPERPFLSPRQAELPGARLPVELTDFWGNEIPPAPAGHAEVEGGVILRLPRLVPGVYSASWQGGSQELVIEGDAYSLNRALLEETPDAPRGVPGLPAVAVVLSALLLGTLLVRKGRAPLAAGIVLLAVAGASVAFLRGPGEAPDPCSQIAAHGERVSCMVAHLYRTLQAEGPEAAVGTVVEFASVPSSPWRRECHELMHMLGEVAWQTTPDLPRLVEAGSVDCTFGFFHGMLEAMAVYTPNESLPELLAEACDRIVAHHGDAFEVTSGCSHGAGHAAMWRTGVDLTLAAGVCGAFRDPRSRDECVSGAVMEWGAARRRAELSGDASSHPEPRVEDPFDLCFPPLLEPSAGCLGGAVLHVGADDLIPSASRCLGLGLAVEAECRNYALVALNNIHVEDEDALLAAVSDLCRGLAWEDGPERCYTNFGFHVMSATISTEELGRVCGRLEEDFLEAACLLAGVPASDTAVS